MTLLKKASFLFFITCILLVGVSFSEQAQEEERLLDFVEQNGILHDAYVQKCFISSRTNLVDVIYQYEVEVSNEVLEYTSREMVSSCTNYQKGDVIKIRYLANMPQQSRIEGNDKTAQLYRRWANSFYYLLFYLFVFCLLMLLTDWYDRFIGKRANIFFYLFIFWCLLPCIFVCYVVIDSIL